MLKTLLMQINLSNLVLKLAVILDPVVLVNYRLISKFLSALPAPEP